MHNWYVSEQQGGVLIGGEYDDEAQHYFAPTVVEVENGEDALIKDEIFGPILPIVKVTTIDEAITFVNTRDKPLALYLFCQDGKVTEHVLRSTTGGSVGVNETVWQVAGTDSFLGGVGESRMGQHGKKNKLEIFSYLGPVMYSTSRFPTVSDAECGECGTENRI